MEVMEEESLWCGLQTANAVASAAAKAAADSDAAAVPARAG